MAKFTAGQVAGLVNLGGPPFGTTVAQWVALADHESSYVTDVENGQFIGLWQISYKWHAGSYGLSKDPETARQQLKNPFTNWGVAKKLFAANRSRMRNIPAGDWMPTWQGSAKPGPTHTAAAENPEQILFPADSNIPIIGGAVDAANEAVETVQDVAGAIGQGVQSLGEIVKWLTDPHNWVRIVYVVGGVGLGLVALSIVAKPVIADVSKTVKPF